MLRHLRPLGAHLEVLATLDPATSEHWTVLGIDRLRAQDDVVLAFILLEVFVLGEERALRLRVGLPGDEFGLFVDEPEAMQQGGHAAGGVRDLESGFDPGGDVLGREVQVCPDVPIDSIESGVGQPRAAAAIRHLQQLGQATAAVTFDMIPPGIEVDQQGIRPILGRPAGDKHDDGLDPIGLALIALRVEMPPAAR